MVPCWLVVVARGLYLARHLTTLSYFNIQTTEKYRKMCSKAKEVASAVHRQAMTLRRRRLGLL